MKKLALVFTFFLLLSTVRAQEAPKFDIQITVENIETDGGQILAALHTAATFMQSEGLDLVLAEGKKGELELHFIGVEPGTYAIMVMHDLNGNFKMDFDEHGIPKERYGMSGNEMPMGPPSFYDAKFEVTDQDLDLKIRL